jgi:predicted AAA+ superfamily ATPase
MYRRNIADQFGEALADSPVVLLNGARQTGKSTLVRSGMIAGFSGRYLTLDDAGVLAAAGTDPVGFLAGLGRPVVLDEVQRVPGLFLAIKAEVDRDRRPGSYLLTGSANVLLLPRLSESLVGRMEVHTLWPLSQGEVEGVREGFVDAAFSGGVPPVSLEVEDPLRTFERVLRGGFPEVVGRESPARRRAWFDSYVTTILQRDVRDLANIERLAQMPRLLSLLAARAAALLNYSELSRSTAMPQSTLKRYMALLETTFLVDTLPAWSGNLGKRLVKSPKLILCDTGLAAHLQGVEVRRLSAEPGLAGPLLENFVAMELKKQVTWSEVRPDIFHFRTQSGQEVDLVLEDAAGRLVAIEVKGAATVGARDFRSLRALAEATGDRFVRGIVLYTGRETVPFGERLFALPVSSLWRWGATNHR